MISYEEALNLILDEAGKIKLKFEKVDLLDSINRILAEDVLADINIPPFDNSAMDGFAIKFTHELKRTITGEVTAGKINRILVGERDAVWITTGSIIPDGADTVIPVENVTIDGDCIIIKDIKFLKKGTNIRLKGSDLTIGKIAVNKFTKINPSVIATLASCGKDKVNVFQKINAGILTTGDELIPITDKPFGAKIRSSNNYSLYSAFKSICQNPVFYDFINDNKIKISEKIKSILSSNIDILITTGGVSVGKYDFLKEVFEESKVKNFFWKVNIKPGMPFFFGIFETANKIIPVFGLPGNPVSALVNFYIFIEPFISRIFKQKEKPRYTAILQNDFTKSDQKIHFVRGIISKKKDIWEVKSLSSQSSGNYYEFANSNCLIIIEGSNNLKQGDMVECIPI